MQIDKAARAAPGPAPTYLIYIKQAANSAACDLKPVDSSRLIARCYQM